MIYLASPYTDPDPAVEQQRFEAVCKAAGALMLRGHIIFAPIAHTHSIALAGDLPRGLEFWEPQDRPMLDAADEFWILMLPGWVNSSGIQREFHAFAARMPGKAVKYIDPETLEAMPK